MDTQEPESSSKLTFMIVGGAVAVTFVAVLFLVTRNSVKPDLSKMTAVEAGQALVERSGCISCHQPNNAFRAPILGSDFGLPVTFQDGSTAIADEAYYEESITHPEAKIRQGYQNIMPSFEASLTPAERHQIVLYIISQAPKRPGG